MSGNDYVAKAKERNPKLFANGKIEMTPAHLEKTLKQAFDAGKQLGEDEKSIMERIFGT